MGLFSTLKKIIGLNIALGAIVAGALTGQPRFIILGASLASSILQTRKGTEGLQQLQQGNLLNNTTNPQSPLPVVYGQTRLGLKLIDRRLDTNSTNDEDLYIVGAFCHGARDGFGIASVNNIYFEGIEAIDGSGTLQTPYTAATLEIAKLTGTDTQDVRDTAINSTTLGAVTADWITTDELAGVAGAIFQLTYDRDVYPTGVPTITALVTGNHTEDTRSEVTGVNVTFDQAARTCTRASGSFVTDGWVAGDRLEVADSTSNDLLGREILTVAATVLTITTTANSFTDEGPAAGITLLRWAHPDNGGDNPWLCVRDTLMSSIYGMGLTDSEIDRTTFEAEADYSDDVVTLTGVTGSPTQTRFRARGWSDTSKSIKARLNDLLSSCRGNLEYHGGVWRAVTTRVKTATFEFGDGRGSTLPDNILSPISIRKGGVGERINVARARFVDPTRDFQVNTTQWPLPGASNTFLTADNSFEVRREWDLPFTDNVHRAQHIVMTHLKESRATLTVGLMATEDALALEVGEVAQVTHQTTNWSGDEFFVMGIRPTQEGPVGIALQQYDSSAYTHDTQSDDDAIPGTDVPVPTTVAAPTGLTVLARATDALQPDPAVDTWLPRIRVTWTDSVSPFIRHYDVQAKLTVDDDLEFDDWGPARKGGGPFFVGPVTTQKEWTVRIRAENGHDVRSDWVSATVTPVAAATVTATTDGFSAARNTAAPENGDVNLEADAAQAFSNLEDANTTPTTYRVYYDATNLSNMDSANSVTVSLWYSDASTGGTFTKTQERTHLQADGDTTDSPLSTGSVALGADFDLLMQIDYANAPLITERATIVAHGEDNAQPGVEFDKFT